MEANLAFILLWKDHEVNAARNQSCRKGTPRVCIVHGRKAIENWAYKTSLLVKMTVKNRFYLKLHAICHAVSKRNATIMQNFQNIIDICDNVCK